MSFETENFYLLPVVKMKINLSSAYYFYALLSTILSHTLSLYINTSTPFSQYFHVSYLITISPFRIEDAPPSRAIDSRASVNDALLCIMLTTLIVGYLTKRVMPVIEGVYD